jgi:DNA-binding IclR family transcriptional regulator
MNSATIPILEKTVSVLEAITTAKQGMSAKNLSITLNIAPASCYRILRTLTKHNWVRDNGHGEYLLAFGLATLTRSYARLEHVLRQLEFPLRALSDDTGLSVKISMREGNYAVTATRTESRRPNAITSPIGSKMHLTLAGAAGTILLASLSREEINAILDSAPQSSWSNYSRESFARDIIQAKEQGISRALGKFHPSIYAIAVPLKFSPTNTAALAVVGWPDDFTAKRRGEIEAQLKKHTRRIQHTISQQS